MNGIYDPAAQKRGLGSRYKLGSHQHLLVIETVGGDKLEGIRWKHGLRRELWTGPRGIPVISGLLGEDYQNKQRTQSERDQVGGTPGDVRL